MAFKVIIVGGGPAGLGLAHCLHKAGIDYILLERSEEICNNDGASLALWPHNGRIMDQLGLLEGAQKIDCHIKYKHNLRQDGSILQKNNMMEAIGQRLGHEWMCFQRYDFLRMLYERLSDEDRESRILSGKALEIVETTADGVRVTCKDGSVYDGSILVGADGVNSAVRKDLATKLSDEKLAEPFTTSYRALYGRSTWTKDIDPGTIYEMHGNGITIQTIPGKTVMFLLYQRLPTSTKGRVRYSKEETEEFAKEFAHIHVTPTVTFGDLWSETEWSFASGLEEGLAETWYGDRVVLIGDTVHKMTPNIGLGLNSGWQSAAVLTNGLRRLLQKDPEPSTQALNSIFREYQGIRKKDASDMVGVSGLYTRVVAWNNPVWKFVDQYVTKRLGGDCQLMDFMMIPMVKKGITLDFLNEPNFKSGTTAWAKGRTMVPNEGEGEGEVLKGSEFKVADVEVAA